MRLAERLRGVSRREWAVWGLVVVLLGLGLGVRPLMRELAPQLAVDVALLRPGFSLGDHPALLPLEADDECFVTPRPGFSRRRRPSLDPWGRFRTGRPSRDPWGNPWCLQTWGSADANALLGRTHPLRLADLPPECLVVADFDYHRLALRLGYGRVQGGVVTCHSAGPDGRDEGGGGDDVTPGYQPDSVLLRLLVWSREILLALAVVLYWWLVWWHVLGQRAPAGRAREAAFVLVGAGLPVAVAANGTSELVAWLGAEDLAGPTLVPPSLAAAFAAAVLCLLVTLAARLYGRRRADSARG